MALSMGGLTINRTQGLVLGFVAAAWLGLIVLLLAAPGVVAGATIPPAAGARAAGLTVLAAVTAMLVVLGVGVVRRWRWMFWLVLLAFLAGILRVPAAALELTGVLPAGGPAWYVLVQAGVGLVQFAIGLAMVAGFRQGGVWGPLPDAEVSSPRDP